jgi:hypothetical protein
MINQCHCDKIKHYPRVEYQIKKLSIFNALKLVYGYLFLLWQGVEIVYFTLPSPIPKPTYFMFVVVQLYERVIMRLIKLIVEILIL